MFFIQITKITKIIFVKIICSLCNRRKFSITNVGAKRYIHRCFKLFVTGAGYTAGPSVHVPEGKTKGFARWMGRAAPDVGEQTAIVVAVTQLADVQQRRQTSGSAAFAARTCTQQG